jgi:hypothetical protein
MSETRTGDVSHLEAHRRALSEDPANLARLDRNIERIKTTEGVVDDMDAISRLLGPDYID